MAWAPGGLVRHQRELGHLRHVENIGMRTEEDLPPGKTEDGSLQNLQMPVIVAHSCCDKR
jgi:hypothetical protein